MRINHNIAALNTYRQLGAANNAQSKSMEKLSSGLRINKAGDDAAGLAISEKMRGQIRGLDMASRNAQDGISMIQTAEGALNESHAILQRMRELAVQASNDTNTGDDRKAIQQEINQLTDEIDRIGNTTEFNGQKLLNGEKSAVGFKFQIGANSGQNFEITMSDMRSTALMGPNKYEMTGSALEAEDLDIDFDEKKLTFEVDGQTKTVDLSAIGDKSGETSDLDATDGIATLIAEEVNNANIGVTMTYDNTTHKFTIKSDTAVTLKTDETSAIGIAADTKGTEVTGNTLNSLKVDNPNATSTGGVMTHDDAANAVELIDNAIKQISSERSKFGAAQNRLDHTINNLNTASENLTAAESRIRDVDLAKEVMEQSKNQILSQAAQAMLSQANQQPSQVLQLLR